MIDNTRELQKPKRGAKYKYILISRCRRFGDWPIDFSHQAELRKVTVTYDGRNVPVYLTFGLKTYDAPDYNKEKEAASEQPKHGPLLVDEEDRPGFWLGNAIIHPAGGKSKLWFKYRNTRAGEIDFFVGIQCEYDISPALLKAMVEPLLATFVTYCSLRLGDFVVPTLSSQISKCLDGGGREFENTYRVLVQNKRNISASEIQQIFEPFLDAVSSLKPEQQRRASAAARRFNNASRESDPIDQFCDLWEACEFLARGFHRRDGTKIKERKPVLRLEYFICDQTALPCQRVHSLLKKLYRIRNDIVHNAVEDPANFDEMTSFLREIANHALRYVLQMEHVPTDALTRYCAQ